MPSSGMSVTDFEGRLHAGKRRRHVGATQGCSFRPCDVLEGAAEVGLSASGAFGVLH